MADLLNGDELLDDALVAALGPVDDVTVHAIVGICNEALTAVLGPAMVEVLGADRRLVPLVAPWVTDLARGLQVLGRCGPGDFETARLFALLGGGQLDERRVGRYVETVDIATTLTLGGVVEHVLGQGACARDQLENDAAAPWLSCLKLGHRVHLAQELLRLMPPE